MVEEKQLISWDKERRARQEEHHRLASGLIKFRGHLQHRLLFAYAAEGNWIMCRKYLNQLYPNQYEETQKADSDRLQPRMERIIRNMKFMYPYSTESKLDKLSCDLMTVLAVEDWNEQQYRAQCLLGKVDLQSNEQISRYIQLCKEPSLIGACDKAMVVAALHNQLEDLVSFAVTKGHLAEKILESALREDAKKLQRSGLEHINGLQTQMEMIPMNFEEMAITMGSLQCDATRAGADGLKSLCETFIKLCKQKNGRLEKTLAKVVSEHSDVCYRIEIIFEMQDLICLLES